MELPLGAGHFSPLVTVFSTYFLLINLSQHLDFHISDV